MAHAPGEAPRQPGVLQARDAELRVYPTGKSAMILYAATGADESLHRYIEVGGRGAPKLERARTLGAKRVRFAVSATPEAGLARLLERFVDRFGAPPAANQAPAAKQAGAEGSENV